ncbi:3-deoxy-7-phosphoheptulonate synthase [Thermodesulfobacteriota bacterium]
MTTKTYDVRIENFTPLISPDKLKEEIPISEDVAKTVLEGRRIIQDIITKKDPRLMVITGPCSIHDEDAALEYAEKLRGLQQKVEKTIYLVMRVYFEKPRTTVGWKGLINDPELNGTYDVISGIKKARNLLNRIAAMGVPTATEILDPFIPQYIAGLLCWGAIGARTTESQTHREMASGLSMPVGFKNSTGGNLSVALNAMIAAASPQHFLGIDQNGKASIVKTTGNPFVHLVMRGGRRPNYDSVSIREALGMLRDHDLNSVVIVDCSHANSRKKYTEQGMVYKDIITQRILGTDSIIGIMLESNLFEGKQKNTGNLDTMKYGVSITDGCISWDMNEDLILWAHYRLSEYPKENSARQNGEWFEGKKEAGTNVA